MWLKLDTRGDLPILSKVARCMRDAADDALPNEACGLLLGRAGRITLARPTANTHPTPETHFEIDPQALIDAHRAEREGGQRVMGYFHSHPAGDPHPSETDKAMSAGDGKVWAIVAGDGLMFWKDDPKGFQPLSYAVTGR
ncbi:MAG: M67 family metallopeptidase [Pseudomonadota bacterium]